MSAGAPAPGSRRNAFSERGEVEMDTFPRRILLATDGSEDAALAGRVAGDLA